MLEEPTVIEAATARTKCYNTAQVDCSHACKMVQMPMLSESRVFQANANRPPRQAADPEHPITSRER